jgi:hypothetical protein
MFRLAQPLLAAAIGIAVAAMLLDMLARGVFGPGRPAEPIDDPPAVVLPACPPHQERLAEAASAEEVEIHDLAKLTPAPAADLDGTEALFRIVIASTSGDEDQGRDRREVYDVLLPDDRQGTLLLVPRGAAQDCLVSSTSVCCMR